MDEMTLEQKKAIALASARARAAGDLPPVEGRSTAADVAIEGVKGLARGAAEFVGTMGEAATALPRHVGRLIAGEPLAQPEPSYGERISKATGIERAPETAGGRYAATIGEVAGHPLSWVGPGSLIVKGLAALASGAGSETAGHAFEGTPLEAPARFLGGFAGPATATVSAETNLAKMRAMLPDREAIKDAASQIYKALETSNVRISPAGMDDLVTQIKTDLNKSGFRSWAGAPGAPIFTTVEELATSGGSTQGIDAVRKVLGRYKPDPANAVAADHAIDAIDDFMMHVDPKYVVSGNPQQDAQALKFAQSLWASNKQLQTIEEGSIRGQHRAGVSGSGANRINTARQEIRKILDSDKKSRGMSQDVKDKMEEIVMGTWVTNRARQIGKFAPSGPVSATTSILTGMGAGAGAGATVAAGGLISKYLGEYLTQRQIDELEAMIRAESPLGGPIARANVPRIAEQRRVPVASTARSVLTTPLSPDAGSALGVAGGGYPE